MTGEDRTLSITGRFNNRMGADLERARRDMRAYIDEVHLGTVPFRELSKAAREFFGAAKNVPQIDLQSALTGGAQVAQQAREGYEALHSYASGFEEVRKAAERARRDTADVPKIDIDAALRGQTTETLRQVDRVRAALASLGRPISELAKPFAEPIAKVKEFGKQTGETLAFLSRPVTAPIGWLKGALDQILTVRTALAGFIAVAGVRAATNLVTDTIRQTADVARLAQSLGTSAESVSAIKFALQSTGIEGGRVVTTFNVLEKAIAGALRGTSREKIVAFRDLGIDVAELQRMQPEELLARIARGLEKIDASQRALALQPLFEDSFRELVPLLGRGEDAFRSLVRQAREFGGVISTQDAAQALEVERSLLRIRTALESVKRSAIIDIAAQWAPGLEELARAIAQNRDLVKGLAEAIANGIATALDVASRAFIGFVGLLDKLPGIDLVDEEKLGRQIVTLKRQLTELQFGPILKLEERRGRPIDGDTEKLQELRKREQDLLREIVSLEQALQGGVAGVLEGARQRMVDAVAQAKTAIKDAGVAQPQPLQPQRQEPAQPERPTDELPGFEQRFALQRERDTLRFQQQLLQLKPQSAAVRDELARIGVELQKNAVLSGEWGQSITDAQIKEALAAIEESFERTGQVVRDLAAEQGLADFERQLLEIGPATQEVRAQLIELQRFADSLQIEIDVQEGKQLPDRAEQLREAQRLRAQRQTAVIDVQAQRELVRFRQELEQVGPVTEQVRLALAELDAQAKTLELDEAFVDGSVSAEQYAQRLGLVNLQLEQNQRQVAEEFARSRNQAEQFLLGLQQQTPEATQAIARLQAELQKLDLERLRREGLLTEEQLVRAFREIEEAAARMKRQFEFEGFFDGFAEGMRQLRSEWTNFANAGQQAAQLVGNSLNGALDTLTDIQLGLTDSNAGWKEWGRQSVREILRVINQLWAMYAVKLITGFFSGSAGGAGGGSSPTYGDIGVSPPPDISFGNAAAGGPNGLLTGAGGLKRLGGGFDLNNYGSRNGINSLGVGQGGGGGPVTIIEHHSHLSLSAVDGESARQFLVRERKTIAHLQADELERNLASRNVVKRIR